MITKSEKETAQIAKNLAEKLRKPSVIALHGNLGSGKTTFTKAFCKALGVTEHVVSPTFLIFKKYELENQNVHTIYHFDLYRIQDPQELIDLGFDEMLAENAHIIIEWPERAKELLPKKTKHVHIKNLGEDIREIAIDQ